MPPSGFPSEYERFGFTAEVLNRLLPISPFSDQRCHIAESHKHARTRQILLHAAIKSLAQLARLPCSTSTIAALLRSDLYRHFLREEIDWIDNASLLANSCTLTSPRKCDVAIISRFSFHSILESPGCIQLLVN